MRSPDGQFFDAVSPDVARGAVTEVTGEFLRSWPLPDPGQSKDDRGSVLIIGGSRGTPGAVALAGLAALRVGAGRVTLAVPESTAIALAVAFPEAGVIALPETEHGSVRGANLAPLNGATGADCVLIGPGLDDSTETAVLLDAFSSVLDDETSVVLDAFALGALQRAPQLVRRARGRLVFTPNLTEAALLLASDQAEPDTAVAEIADRYDAAVTCQGWIADGGTDLYRAPGGGPVLGTAGSGDVLAGAVAGLLARGLPPIAATCWGTRVHALAGDVLTERMGPVGALAREIVDELPGLLAALSQ